MIKQVIAYSSGAWADRLGVSMVWNTSNFFSGARVSHIRFSESWNWNREESRNYSNGWRRRPGRW